MNNGTINVNSGETYTDEEIDEAIDNILFEEIELDF